MLKIRYLSIAVIVLSLIIVTGIEFNKESSTDLHGITKLYSTKKHGMNWVSNWTETRDLGEEIDPQDPWFTMPENSSYYQVRDNELWISGRTPRMYIHDPELKRQWRDVEITMYFKRVSDDSTNYAGMVSIARSNHGVTGRPEDNLCDSRGYGGRLRYDGYTDFEKEIAHGRAYDTSHAKLLWLTGMPYDVWFGYKYVVYDLPNGHVKLELWLDTTDGLNGGTWKKINEMVDDGTQFGQNMVGCASGVDPAETLNNGSTRTGSESGKPNVSIYFRTDNVTRNGGLRYKNGSIREISLK